MPRLLRHGLPLVLLLLGALGVGAVLRREQGQDGAAPTGGAFWTLDEDATDAAGAADAVGAADAGEDGEQAGGAPPPAAGGLRLDAGRTLRFLEEDSDVRHFASIAFVAQAERPGSTLEVTLRGTAHSSLVVSLRPGDPFAVSISERSADGRDRVLASGSGAGLLVDPLATFSGSVGLDGADLGVRVLGRRLASWRQDDGWRGKVCLRAGAGSIRLQRVSATGTGTTQRGGWKPFSLSQGLVAPAPSPARTALIGLGAMAGAWLFAALWLSALCRGRAGIAAIAAAAGLALAPACLPLAAAIARTPANLEALVGAGLMVGVVFAIASLRPGLLAGADGAAGTSARASAPLSRRLRWLRPALAAALVLALLGGTALLCGRQMHAARSAAARHDEAARRLPVPAPWSISETLALDASNARHAPDPYHNVAVSARVLVPEGAALGVRLRAPGANRARGRLLVLSADPRLPSGFWREDQIAFDPPDEPAAVPPPGRSLRLDVTARGRELSATLDGRPFASALDDEFLSGVVTLLALRGAVQVEGLTVTGLPADEAPAPIAASVAGAAAALPLAVALFAALAAALLRRPLLPTLHACAFALGPAALVLAFPRHPGHVNDDELLRMGLAASVLLAAWALLPGPGALRPGWRAAVLVPAAALLVASGLRLTVDRSIVVDASLLNRMSYLDWKGERLDADLLCLRHPIMRRWNEYLAQHTFRDRRFTLAKPEGTVRILALGGSSTWGFRIPAATRGDYPSQLEQRLADARAGGEALPPVEVINGAIVGATGGRLYACVRDSLLAFAPDIVTLSLTFNDSSSLSQGDEDAYYESITAPGATRSWWTERRLARERAREREALTAIKQRLHLETCSTMELWRAYGQRSSPPERFAAVLRRFAELGRARGFRLVLIKEPFVGPGRLVWREEFSAVIDAVAAEYDLPVVDPGPDLDAAGGASLFMDCVHPTAEGNAVIARRLEHAVRGLLAPSAAPSR